VNGSSKLILGKYASGKSNRTEGRQWGLSALCNKGPSKKGRNKSNRQTEEPPRREISKPSKGGEKRLCASFKIASKKCGLLRVQVFFSGHGRVGACDSWVIPHQQDGEECKVG